MADRGGLLTRATAALGKIFLKRELVGVDALGNKYFKKMEQNVLDEPIERRWVQTPDGLYDPEAVPPEWYQWLRKRRNAAPSMQEVQQMGSHRVQIQQKAAALDAQEQQRRFQAATTEDREASEAQGPNMQRFVQQLSGKGFAEDTDAAEVERATSSSPEDNSSQPSGWQPSSGPPHAEKREIPVSTTMDGKEQQSSASAETRPPSDSFQPEAWSPGKS